MPTPGRICAACETPMVSVLLLASFVCGCAGQVSSTSSTMGSPVGAQGPASAAVFFCGQNNNACAPSTSFQLSTLRDLLIFVRWDNLPAGNHLQTLDIFLPDGNPYQTIETSFEVAAGPAGSHTNVNALPVAGTWLARRPFPGAWSVEVSLDGQFVTRQTVQLVP
jgi:hypothetical protein